MGVHCLLVNVTISAQISEWVVINLTRVWFDKGGGKEEKIGWKPGKNNKS